MPVRHAVLGLLAQRPRHGYELRAAFEAVVGGEENWDVKPAQIYSTLTRLEKKGLVAEDCVEQDGGPEKHIYSITPAGRTALLEWFATGIEREHQRDEFFIKLMLSLVSGEANPRVLLQTQRNQLYQEMHAITTQRNGLNPKTELARILLLDKAIMHLEADLRWIDMIEGRLDEVTRQPLPAPEAKPRGRPRKI
ncbi:MAG: PadR family transcriptional regulator [Chloroflexi bacterium]|nr:PadR family transcriptional regulator [Chloroflexota bacterium]